MAGASEYWVRAQLLLRCLQHPGWEVLVGGFGHDFALLNTKTGERRTIEVKSRQALEGLTRHYPPRDPSKYKFGTDLYDEQTEADFLAFIWFDRSLVFVIPIREMKAGSVRSSRTGIVSPRRSIEFLPSSEWLNAWEQLFI